MIYARHGALVIRSLECADMDLIIGNFSQQRGSRPRALLERYLHRQAAQELIMFVAALEDDVAGYVILYPSPANGPFAGTEIAEISDFIVFDRFQRRGIGGKLLDAAEETAAETRDRVSLGVGLHSGYGPAQRMYAKRGYVPDGSGVWFNNAPLEPYADCKNDDELVLYLSKALTKARK